MVDTKVPKEIAKDMKRRTVTIELFGTRTTKRKDGTPAANPKIVFALAGALDVQRATKAGYPILNIYGDAKDFNEGDIIEVTIKPMVQAK